MGRRAFLLCGGNRTFTVFDLDAHKRIAHFPLPAGADVVKFDPGLRRAYVACSSVDPVTHRVYAPEESENGKPAARMVVYEAIAGDRK